MTTTEQWASIEGFSRYEVSNRGRVRVVATGRVRVLHLSRLGYVKVGLIRDDGIKQTRYVHRMVALAFIPNPNKLPQVNHLDGVKTNSTVENLEWVTQSRNLRHSYKHGMHKPKSGDSNGRAKLTWYRAREIRRLYAKGNWTQAALAEAFEVKIPAVRRILHNESWREDLAA